jgi:hypothetical protein
MEAVLSLSDYLSPCLSIGLSACVYVCRSVFVEFADRQRMHKRGFHVHTCTHKCTNRIHFVLFFNTLTQKANKEMFPIEILDQAKVCEYS